MSVLHSAIARKSIAAKQTLFNLNLQKQLRIKRYKNSHTKGDIVSKKKIKHLGLSHKRISGINLDT